MHLVISEIDSSAATSLHAVTLLALCLTGDKVAKVPSPVSTNGREIQQLHALNAQIFIKIHRSDYAEKQLKCMQQIDKDPALTQHAKAGHRYYFAEKYPMTGKVLNGKAVFCMHVRSFESLRLFLGLLNKLKLSHPDHVLVKGAASLEENFERALQADA
ncbi:hypothetical protein U9M48_033782 [Paspalum notatum var. saurae]|uniref:Uncharacterized protein n=1 Tax=Paspalum notatum var. saurae TaxID=547442 RepID=A0AAQ3U874_PASNO